LFLFSSPLHFLTTFLSLFSFYSHCLPFVHFSYYRLMFPLNVWLYFCRFFNWLVSLIFLSSFLVFSSPPSHSFLPIYSTFIFLPSLYVLR
jgi:hypothetical protein